MRTLIIALLALCLAPSVAAADPASGGASLAIATSLKAKGVRIVATDPATATTKKVQLPTYDATVGATAVIRHSGVLQLKTKRARLNLTGLVTTLGTTSKTTAIVGGKRVTVLTYGGKAKLDATAGSASLKGAPARLTAAAAKALRRALGLRKAKAGKLGTADIAVSVRRDAAPTGTPAPVATPAPGEPAPQQRILWRPRESFIRYMHSEDGTVTASGGAQDGPKEVRPGTDAALVYSYLFPTGTGTLAFKWQGRGIDISFTDPQLAGNQLSVVFNGETTGSYAGKRVAMLDLDTAKATADGYPAKLTEDGSKAFAGFYQPGDEWGYVNVSAPTTRSVRIAAAATKAKRKPLRIVALSPFTANTLVDLGITPVAIANTLGGADRFRPQLKTVKRLNLSHPNGPNLEQLAALDPDIVLSSPTWARGHAAMKELGMKVALDDPTRVGNVAAMTRKIGKLVGKAKLAGKLAAKQQKNIDASLKGIKRHPRVLAVLGVGRSPYAFLPGSWGGDVITKAGGKLLTEGLKGDGGFAKISDEQVVAINPDVIIAVPHGNAKDIPSIGQYLKNNPSWQSTNAARNDHVYVATGNSLLQAFTDVENTIRDVGTKFLLNR